MQSIILTNKNGDSTIVDSDIAEKIKDINFDILKHGYVRLLYKNRKVYLHRFVMKAVKGQYCDHINGRKNDNRRCNLRICSQSENNINKQKIRKTKSNLRNVCFDSHYKRRSFNVQLKLNKKIIFNLYYCNRIIAGLIADFVRESEFEYSGYSNFPVKVKRENLLDFLKRDRGKFFCVYFARRSDGKIRKMICRTGVPGKPGGPGLAFDPKNKNLLSVYDIVKKKHRFIPLENVLCLSIKKQRVAVLN